ncbi:MAG: hypothetical protein ABIO55_05560 [Ginsengibacter sp.]
MQWTYQFKTKLIGGQYSLDYERFANYSDSENNQTALIVKVNGNIMQASRLMHTLATSKLKDLQIILDCVLSASNHPAIASNIYLQLTGYVANTPAQTKRKKEKNSCVFNVHLFFNFKKTNMKKVIFFSLVLFVFFSCNESAKTDDMSSKSSDSTSTTSKTSDAKALYEKNLASLQAGITAFENKKIDDWAATVADAAVWNSPAYGAKPGGKEDWKKALSAYTANWDNLKLVNPVFLPGIDSLTHEFDGSVRYYGAWEGVHKSGVKTSVNFYGTYEFNNDNKVVDGSDFFDVGGLMDAIKPK